MILDTNAISALFIGDSNLAKVLAGSLRHHLPVIVLGEYRYGLLQSRDRARLGALLNQLERQSVVLEIDRATTRVYARVREQLRERGTPIPENDVWIAALAVQHRLPIVSKDNHFDVVPGLKRIAW